MDACCNSGAGNASDNFGWLMVRIRSHQSSFGCAHSLTERLQAHRPGRIRGASSLPRNNWRAFAGRGECVPRTRKHMPSMKWPMHTSHRRAARLSERFSSEFRIRNTVRSNSAYQAMTAFGSRNASRPNTPYSRPIPDCLNPPKGASGSCGAPLTITRPQSSRSASACMRAASVP